MEFCVEKSSHHPKDLDVSASFMCSGNRLLCLERGLPLSWHLGFEQTANEAAGSCLVIKIFWEMSLSNVCSWSLTMFHFISCFLPVKYTDGFVINVEALSSVFPWLLMSPEFLSKLMQLAVCQWILHVGELTVDFLKQWFSNLLGPGPTSKNDTIRTCLALQD